MKKLMIAACAIALAAGVQAANYSWSTENIFDGYKVVSVYDGNVDAYMNNYAAVGGVTAYLINATACDYTTAIGLIHDGKTAADLSSLYGVNNTDPAKVSGAVAGGAIAYSSFASTDAALNDNLSAYFAITVDGYTYLSNKRDALATQLQNPSDFQFGSQDALVLAVEGFDYATGAAATSSAGWYTAVPEPTSGLLLLLGVAGLALRRRRA